MTQLAPTPVFRGVDAFGFPLYLGQLGTFIAGTNTPQVTYKDSLGIATNTNPVILNPRGECNLWLDPTKAYKLVLSDALGNLIWTVDNVTIGNANPSFSIIPTTDNLYNLGSPTFSWANVYAKGNVFVGPNLIPVLGASGNVGYYKRTAAEIALAVTPTDFSYPADPYVDPRRYGADPSNNPATAVATTLAVQTAINVAYQNGNMVWIGSGCKFRINPVSLTMTGSATAPLRIEGSSQIGSALVAVAGTSTPLVTFTTANPNVGPLQAFLQIQNLSIVSGGIVVGGHGLSTYDLAYVLLDNVRISGFDRNFDIQNCITITLRECQAISGNYGGRIALFGAYTGGGYPTTNFIRLDNCVINLNLIRGVEYNGGTGLFIRGCDIESNGTSVVCTAPPASGSTTATLTAVWPFATGAYFTAFPDGQTRNITFTNGSTAISWTGALTATQPAAYINPTGGIFILGQCSPDLGEAHVCIEDSWLETNQMQLCVAAQTAGALMRLAVKSCELAAAVNGRNILVAGADKVLLEDLESATPGDNYNITCNFGTLINVDVASLTATGITVPFFANVSQGGIQQPGRQDSANLVLTGCTTSPNVLTFFYQQLDEITVLIGDVQATSNTTACTLTGIPAKYSPGGTYSLPMVIEDNGADLVQFGVIGVGATVLTLTKGGSATGFTAAGAKGPRRNILKWKTTI